MRPILTLASLTVSALLYAPFLGLSDALATEPDPWEGWTCTVDGSTVTRIAPGEPVPVDAERIACESWRPDPARTAAANARGVRLLREARATGRIVTWCAFDTADRALLGPWGPVDPHGYDDEAEPGPCPVTR
jgi:hypothetical protein